MFSTWSWNTGAAAAKKTLSLQNFLQDENQVEISTWEWAFLILSLLIEHFLISRVSFSCHNFALTSSWEKRSCCPYYDQTVFRMAPTVRMVTTWKLTWPRLEIVRCDLKQSHRMRWGHWYWRVKNWLKRICSVEFGWGGVDCHGELPQLHPRYAQVF